MLWLNGFKALRKKLSQNQRIILEESRRLNNSRAKAAPLNRSEKGYGNENVISTRLPWARATFRQEKQHGC